MLASVLYFTQVAFQRFRSTLQGLLVSENGTEGSSGFAGGICLTKKGEQPVPVPGDSGHAPWLTHHPRLIHPWLIHLLGGDGQKL